MKPNIFWRATRRQPLRTILLLLLTAIVAFAFTARAVEYLLVKQETDRLSSYYKASGRITRLKGATTADMASFDEVKEFLENDPRVDHTSWIQECSAVLPDMYNADVYGGGSMNECKNRDYYFTGTLLGINEARGFLEWVPYAPTLDGDWDIYCYFRQEQALVGAPELVWEGHIVKVWVPQEKARAVLDMLTVGGQYLIHGQGNPNLQIPEDVSIEKPTVRNPNPDETILDWERKNYHEAILDWEFVNGGGYLEAKPLAPDGTIFYPVPASGEIDWSDPTLNGVEEEMQSCREEQGALWVITSHDMETIKNIQPDTDIYLVNGRWLNYEDHTQQRKVCVVHNELLKVRGLSIGDTITVKLRDITWENFQWGYIIFPFTKDYKTATDTYQIVGSYDNVRPYYRGYHVDRNEIFLPFFAMPADFDAAVQPPYIGDLTFTLTSPDVTEEFLADTRDALAEMTLQIDMWENGWEEFQAAVQPMLQSSLYNLVIFALIFLTALCLVAFFYLRARRRDLAIARALGVPAGVCVRQSALPLLLIGFAGTLCGGCLGWRYAMQHGTEALTALDSYGDAVELTLPYSYLAALLGGMLLLVLILAFGGMAWLAHRSALTLLQGGAQVKQKEEQTAQMAALDTMQKAAGAAVTPAGIVPSGRAFSAAPVQPAKHSLGVAHTLRFIGCYIRRSKVKSLLVLLLAVLFTVGLAAIRISILNSGARMDDLYNTISIQMTLMPKSSTDYVMGGFAAQNTIDSIQNTGFVQDAYLEGLCAVTRIRREDVFLADSSADEPQTAPRDGDTGENFSNGAIAKILSFGDLDRFLSNSSEVEITYQDGWDAEMLAKDWTDSETLPVLMPSFLCESLNISLGSRVALDILREDSGTIKTHLFQVVGTYTGTPATSQNDGALSLLAPVSVLNTVTQNHTFYTTARFTLNPAWNRELDTVRAAVEEITEDYGAGLIPLRPMIWDEELKQAVEPLENSIRLMETLFPVALALSLLAALGVSALLILTEAREAAIMRVLGTTKLRSRIILSLQVIFMVLAGLMIGLTVSFAWAGSLGLAWAAAGMTVICAAAYLLCATAGSAAGAVIVTNRPPLELLQVKE